MVQSRKQLGLVGLAALLGTGCLVLGQRGEGVADAAAAQVYPRAPDVIYKPTPYRTVDAMLKVTAVKKGEMVYDLGCGDGRIVITAAQKYGARGIGVDIDPQRIKESNENAKKAGVTDRVKFLQADLFEMDFKDADVITLYLLPELNRKLRPKLLGLRPGTRIVSHAFDMGDWKPDKTVRAYTVHYWVVPARVAGSWQWTMPAQAGEERYVLQLKQVYQNVSGAMRRGGRSLPVTEGKLTGDTLSITVAGEEQGKPVTMHLRGRVRGGNLQGTLEIQGGPSAGKHDWTATRDETSGGAEPAGG